WVERLPALWAKIPAPKAAIAIGNCPVSGCVYNRRETYILGPVAKYIPIAAEVPGCPPRPTEILSAVLAVAPTVFRDYEVNRS
ncbi:MAG: hypothetical protein LUO99_04725, partial [Methanomicrobiales archaeon]|nr:hypothetical protein [Methanomicrobiales archaeon]